MNEYDPGAQHAEAFTATRDFKQAVRRVLHSDLVPPDFRAEQADIDAPIHAAWGIPAENEEDELSDDELQVI